MIFSIQKHYILLHRPSTGLKDRCQTKSEFFSKIPPISMGSYYFPKRGSVGVNFRRRSARGPFFEVFVFFLYECDTLEVWAFSHMARFINLNVTLISLPFLKVR